MAAFSLINISWKNTHKNNFTFIFGCTDFFFGLSKILGIFGLKKVSQALRLSFLQTNLGAFAANAVPLVAIVAAFEPNSAILAITAAFAAIVAALR